MGLTPSLDGKNTQQAGLLVAAIFLVTMPLEISHILSALVGAAAYVLLQTLQSKSVVNRQPVRKPNHNSNNSAVPSADRQGYSRNSGATLARPPNRSLPVRTSSGPRVRDVASAPGNAAVATAASPKEAAVEIRKPSAHPVHAPTFQSQGWEDEVTELLSQITPTKESEMVVNQIAASVKKYIAPILPEAEVLGFTAGNLQENTAFGVAVPEVDIVINVRPRALLNCLQGRWSQGRNGGDLDVKKLQKSAIRACTDRLVGTGDFKFRRSAFRGPEPKITMIAPFPTGQSGRGVPMNLSVNCETPLYNAALFTESGQIEQRAQALIVLVKRWAKDRGLCHVSKGHLPPYAWTLLAVYYLQVRDEGEGPLLPPLNKFKNTSTLLDTGAGKAGAGCHAPTQEAAAATEGDAPKVSVGVLFKNFVHFYTKSFDWRKEAVSVRHGRRLPPDASLPLNVLVGEGGVAQVAPSIEDPFRAGSNLGACMVQASLAHLLRELERAHELCSRGASLTELLEPWAPPETEGCAAEEDE